MVTEYWEVTLLAELPSWYAIVKINVAAGVAVSITATEKVPLADVVAVTE